MWRMVVLLCTLNSAAVFAQETDAAAEETESPPTCLVIGPELDPEGTVAACNVFLDTTPPDTEKAVGLAHRGIALRVLGQLEDSVTDLRDSLDLLNDPSTQAALAWTLREMGLFEDADVILTEVLTSQDIWQHRLSRCIVRHDAARFKDAVADCETALLLAPENTDAMYFTARVHNFLKDGRKSLPLLRKVQQIDPGNPRYEPEMVWALYYTGQTRRALARAQVLLRENPDNAAMQEFVETVKE